MGENDTTEPMEPIRADVNQADLWLFILGVSEQIEETHHELHAIIQIVTLALWLVVILIVTFTVVILLLLSP